MGWDRLQKIDANLARAVLEAKCLDNGEAVRELARIVSELKGHVDKCLITMNNRAKDVPDPPIVPNNVFGDIDQDTFACEWLPRVLSRLRAPRGERVARIKQEEGLCEVQLPDLLVLVREPQWPNLVDVTIVDDVEALHFFDIHSAVEFYEVALVKLGLNGSV